MAGISGVKEGSIMEGILAMYIAMIFCDEDDAINSAEVLKNIRKLRIQTELKETGKPRITLRKKFPKDNAFGYTTATINRKTNKHQVVGEKYFVQQQEGKPADFVQVILEVDLKPAEVWPGFGKEYKKYVQDNSDYGKVETKIHRMIDARDTVLFRKIIDAKNKFLANKKDDVVVYTVKADGVAGEQADGNIKADIDVHIFANGRILVNDHIAISVKSESSTVQNSGVVGGLNSMFQVIGVPANKKRAAEKLMEDIVQAKGQAKLEYVSAMFDLMAKNLVALSKNPKFTNVAFDFLHEAIFGDDLADVVDLGASKVKEMTVAAYNSYRQYGNSGKPVKLKAVQKPGDIRIVATHSKSDNDFLFKFRFKKRNYKDGTGQWIEKIMIETGPLAYKK